MTLAREEKDFQHKLVSAEFEKIEIEPTSIYRAADAREFLSGQGIDLEAPAPRVDGKFFSAFIPAV